MGPAGPAGAGLNVANVYTVSEKFSSTPDSIALCNSASDIPLGGGCVYPSNATGVTGGQKVWTFGIYQDPSSKKWGYRCAEGSSAGVFATAVCMKP